MGSPRLLKNVFDWDYFFIYLSGPIDFAADGGRGWREEWVERLSDIGVKKEHILNPCKKPLTGARFNLDNESKIMRQHREDGDWDKMCEVMSQIVHIDLRFVDLSSLILVNFPQAGSDPHQEQIDLFMHSFQALIDRAWGEHLEDKCKHDLYQLKTAFDELLVTMAMHQVPTYGTIHEVIVARQQRKPVLAVWEGGLERCSGWMQWLIGHENIFPNIDELISHLVGISEGKTAYNANDWLLLNLSKNR